MIPAIIPSTSVALCLTVASESFSRDFKLAPIPEKKNYNHKLLVFWWDMAHWSNWGKCFFFGLELHVRQILVSATFQLCFVVYNYS